MSTIYKLNQFLRSVEKAQSDDHIFLIKYQLKHF